jgi:hypothetical protein
MELMIRFGFEWIGYKELPTMEGLGRCLSSGLGNIGAKIIFLEISEGSLLLGIPFPLKNVLFISE